MGAIRFRLGSELRSRWRAWLALAVLVGLAGGIVLFSVAGARRTDSAYDRLAGGANAHDAFVLGAQFDIDLDAVARLPEVAEAAHLAYAALEDFDVTPLMGVDDLWFTRIDRPKVLAGRRPHADDPEEVAITPPVAAKRGLKVGSSLTLRGYSPDQFKEIFAGGDAPVPAGPVVTLRVVGIEVSPNEGELVDSVRSGDNLHLTPAFYRAYAGRIGMLRAVVVRLHNGPADLASFKSGVERIAAGLPVQVTSQADEGAKVQSSIHLQAVAIALFAALAALAAILTVGQALAREAFVAAADHPVLRAVGMTRRELWGMTLLRAGAIGAVGALVAVGLSVAASALMPLGLARLAEPSVGVSVDALVVFVGLVAIPALTVALTVVPAWRTTTAVAVPVATSGVARPVSWAERLARAGFPPSAVNGVRLAVDPGRGRTAAPTRAAILGATFSIAALATALSFGASLDRLLSTPRLYGWNWDIVAGNPFIADLTDAVVPVLRQSPSVAAFSGVAASEVDVGGARTQAIGVETHQGSVLPPIVEGRAPRQPDEVVLGAKTLRSADRSVGDVIDVRVGDNVARLRIVGKAVFPVLGLFDVGGLGDGALFTMEGLRRLVPAAPQNVFIVRLAEDADRAAVLEQLGANLAGGAPLAGPEPPSDVADFGRVDNMPTILSGLLAVMAAASVAHALVSTVRRRRRDVAILKTLGFVRRQVRATVAWQASTMTALALAIGLPVGIAAGRWAWQLFGDGLGIVPEPVIPVVAVLLTVPAALLVANLIAAIPGWTAARTRPATALRAE